MMLLEVLAALENDRYELLKLGQCVIRVIYVCWRLVSVSIFTSNEAGIEIPNHPSLA
jgi:hypothetical protein